MFWIQSSGYPVPQVRTVGYLSQVLSWTEPRHSAWGNKSIGLWWNDPQFYTLNRLEIRGVSEPRDRVPHPHLCFSGVYAKVQDSNVGVWCRNIHPKTASWFKVVGNQDSHFQWFTLWCHETWQRKNPLFLDGYEMDVLMGQASIHGESFQ